METDGLRRGGKKKKTPSLFREAGGLEKKTGGALLSHAPGRSTIAAGALNVRVRTFMSSPRPFRFRGSAGGGAGKPHGLSEPVC